MTHLRRFWPRTAHRVDVNPGSAQLRLEWPQARRLQCCPLVGKVFKVFTTVAWPSRAWISSWNWLTGSMSRSAFAARNVVSASNSSPSMSILRMSMNSYPGCYESFRGGEEDSTAHAPLRSISESSVQYLGLSLLF